MAETKPKEYHLVVFSIGDEEFGVDIAQVREIIRLRQITYLPKAPNFVEGVINLRGQIVAVINLAKRLGVPSKAPSNASRIIILEMGNNSVGMIVDAVSEVLKLAPDQIQQIPEFIETGVPQAYIYGVAKLKDRLLVLLDLNRVLSPEEMQHMEHHLKSVPNEEDKKEQGR